MLDINGGEMLVLLVVAVIVIGPERLPRYAEQLAGLVKRARVFLASTRERVDEELGDGSVDWAKLDPRQYDPRRIVRDALLDDDLRSTFSSVAGPLAGTLVGGAESSVPASGGGAAAATAGGVVLPAFADPSRLRREGAPVPFDDEAT